MNAETLKALVIDQRLGELPAEASELLEAHLAQDPAAHVEAEHIRETLVVTEETVNRCSDLFGEPIAEEPTPKPFPLLPTLLRPRLRAVAAGFILVLVALGGYAVGVRMPSEEAARVAADRTEPDASRVAQSETDSGGTPWARYRIENGRLQASVALVGSSEPEPSETQ